MVCKINFDYEISLSADNDSISSSEFSTDDESLNKKFVLGDNILDVNPLKIISVRQLNNLNNSNSNESISEIQISDENHNKNVPLNNYLCYDDSISNFEEESVSESELNLYYNPVTLTESEFNLSHTHFKYELPILDRFQPQQLEKKSENIDSISRYCIKEKLNRLQKRNVSVEKANQTLSNKDSETELNFVKNKPTKIRSIENNVTVSNTIENSTISPEILKGLSIDVLTKFINGEKSAEEIMNQINKNSNKKRKKPKKLKRHNNEKYSNKHSVKQNPIPTSTIKSIESVESIVIPKQSELESLIGNSLINTELLSPLGFISNETEIIDEVTLENCKVIDSDNKYDTEIMETKITSLIIQSPECINVDNSLDDKEIFTDISNENDKSKDSQQIFKSGKESESCLSNHHHHESFGFNSNCNEELSENKKIPVLNMPEILNEEISKVSLFQQCEPSVTKDNHNNNNNNDDKTVNRIEETYENKSNQDSDECKDMRTSSTDSGFHDCDNDETNDEVPRKINKSQPLISDLQCSKIENKTEKTEDLNIENNAQIISMKKFLDFSSFKFKFINKSNLRNIDSSNSPLREISSENKNTLIVTDKSLKSNILNNAEKNCQKITDSSLSLSSLSSSAASFNNNQLVNEHTPTDVDYSLFQSEHSNTSNSNSKNETSKIIDKLSDSITDTNFTTIAYQIPSTKHYQHHHHRYHPFKVDYYSPEAAIINKEEISEFLDFQWLKFCEKYTISNHNMNIL